MSRFILRETGAQLLREGGQPFLREDGALGLVLSEAFAVAAVGRSFRSASAAISQGLTVSATGSPRPSVTVGLVETLSVSVSASSSRSASPSISEAFALAIQGGRNVARITEAFAVAASASSGRQGFGASVAASLTVAAVGRKVVSGSAAISLPDLAVAASGSSSRSASASISEALLAFVTKGNRGRITEALRVSVRAPDLRPDSPLQLRSTRSGASVALQWVDSFGTAQVQVFRSLGQREPMSLRATVAAGLQAYTDSAGTDQVASYQLRAVAPNGAKSKGSYIIYNAPPSQIL